MNTRCSTVIPITEPLQVAQERHKTYVIKGGQVIDPAHEIDGDKLDILVKDGRIAGISPGMPARGPDDIDATGLFITPGLVDVHVHLREPGQEHKETIATGTLAAAAGGYTTIVCEPNTLPYPIDRPARLADVQDRIQETSVVRVYTKAAITQKMPGQKLTDFANLKRRGAVALTDDGYLVQDEALMREACKQAGGLHILLTPHCEDSDLVLQEQPSAKTKTRGELDRFVDRDVQLAKQAGCHIHISHVSRAGTLNKLREYKRGDHLVTAEATPHHLTLTKEAEKDRTDTNAKVNPPLRSKQDVDALVAGLKSGIIDIVATDHAPHTPKEKAQPWATAPHGIIGLETAFGVVHTRLILEGPLTLYELVEKMSFRPAEIFALPAGSITFGSPADLTIIDTAYPWTVDPEKFLSKGRNCPFAGWELYGKVLMTLVNGRRAYTDPAFKERVAKRASPLQESLLPRESTA